MKAKHSVQIWLLTILLAVAVVVPVSVAKNESSKPDGIGVNPALSPLSKEGQENPKTAEQVYKNIQVFKGLPASDLEPTMAFISGSLGVKCSYCHVNPFDKDERATKQTARQMIKMVFEINKGNFSGAKSVSCFTCHRGSPQPLSVPAVGQNLWQPGSATSKEKPLPTVDEILSKYVQAIGGAEALHKINSRVVKGSRIGADGVLVPEEVYQKAPNKILTVTTYPQNTFRTGFNGSAAWGSSSRDGARDLPDAIVSQLKIDSEFYLETKLKELYRELVLVGASKIGDAEVYVIKATPLSGDAEKLFFDAQTGLLVRRYKESELLLGKFPLQTDYEDFREVDGVKQPFLIRWSMPGRSWGRKINEIKQNVPIDDGQFNPPTPKP
ncbi:MAG TPA: c-type cytochrome [Pyrinomonadaceae bacterium]|nr:c-type cytochrome [Pyrinomonadaceae bacterium]